MRFSDFSGSIMYKDQELMKFCIDKSFVSNIEKITDKYLPFEFNLSESYEKAVLQFLEDRVVPEHRQGLAVDLKSIGISQYDPVKLLQYNHGSSVSDDYWIKFDKEEIDYADVYCKMMNIKREEYDMEDL